MAPEAGTPSRRRALFAGAGALLALAGLEGLGLLVGPLLPRLEGAFLDAGFRARIRAGTAPAPDPRVVPVRIEREGMQRFGRWPWPRSVHARLLGKARETLAPRGAIFDVLFRARTSREEDAAFAAGLEEFGKVGLAVGVHMTPDIDGRLRTKRVFGDPEAVVERLAPPRPGFPRPREWVRELQAPLADFTRAAGHVGHVRSLPDPDGVFRRVQPFLVVDDRVLPALGIVGACMALRIPIENVTVEGSELVFAPGGDLREERRFPLGPDGAMLIDWAAPFGRGWTPVRMWELGDDPDGDLRARAEDRLFVVGVAGLEVDMGPTPVDARDVPLMETHLHFVNMLLQGSTLRAAPAGAPWLCALLLVALIALAGSRPRPLVAALAGAAPLVAYPALAGGLFVYAGLVLPVAPVVVLGTGAYLGLLVDVMLTQERARGRVEENFSRYFSREVVARILRDPAGATLGGQRKELTILFSDIKGFTTTSEKIEPDVLAEFLGEYFDQMVEIVFAHQGTVDKFMGDGLMAFWGDPVDLEDHALRAVRAAREMQAAAAGLSERWADRLQGPFRIRIGINTGNVTVGNMGGQRRMDYTVMGRAVNLAQRLESSADPGGILIGERTHGLLPEGTTVGERREIRVKGVEHDVPCFPVPVD